MSFILEIGDTLTLRKSSSIYTGKIVSCDEKTIILELNSGYIVGFEKQYIEIINIDKKSYEVNNKKEKKDKRVLENRSQLKTITILSTGGTISCSSGKNMEAVIPTLSASDLVDEIPEINKYANLKTKNVMNKLSENINPKDWLILAQAIKEEIEYGVDGIIVTCGTDTMVYIASAIAYMIKTPIPIVFTGSQRSADRPSSDNYMNLICAVHIATSDIAEVTIVMHGTLSDDYCLVHRAVKTKKMHTSRRNTFQSINTKPIAKVYFENGNIEILSNYIKRNENKLQCYINLCCKCGLIKFYPGLNPNILDYYIENNY